MSSPEELPVTVVTWNVHGCAARLSPFESERVADVLAGVAPDVVCLQETAALDGRKGFDQVAAIARLLGMTSVFGPNVVARRGRYRYGNAILSRSPIVGSVNHDLSVGHHERRGALVADVDLKGRTLAVASVHLGLSAGERHHQAHRLVTLFAGERAPDIVGGDMNDWFPGRDTRTLRARFSDAAAGGRATYPSRWPLFRLDHLYVGAHVRVESCEPVRSANARAASDHLPLVARLAVGVGAGAAVEAAEAIPATRRALG